MANIFEYLKVPQGDKAVYGLAEDYFVERLTAHFHPIGYDCFREYAYGGGSTFMPAIPTVSHMNKQRKLILNMLQGGDDAFGFRFLKPKKVKGKLKERGFQKPDFLAFRDYDGVVGEIGTADMRVDKKNQLNSRLRDLKLLVEEEVEVQTLKSIGKPVSWHGMTWRAAPYHPEEGPIVIPVDEDRLISTLPTFEPKIDGLYLYQLLRYQRHRLPVGDPVALPRLSPETQEQLKEAWRRYQQPGGSQPGLQGSKPNPRQPGWLDGWPALAKELLTALAVVGIAVVVVTAVAVVVSALGLVTAAAAAVAGFAAVLISGLTARAKPGVPQI